MVVEVPISSKEHRESSASTLAHGNASQDAVKTPNLQNDQNDQNEERTPSKFVRAMRKVYRPVGFKKGYNFPLWIIFAGAMLGFSLARLQYLDIGGSASSSFKNGASPGEWYHYREGHYRIGITLHLGCIIPAGLLVVFQFTPILRHKFLLFHRINGYIIVLLALIANVGALMIARRAFGGGVETQAATGLLVIITTISLVLAYINIKRLQIDQHRAWMLRAWFYFGSIITTRIIMVISAQILSKMGDYVQPQTCGQVAYGYDGHQISSSDIQRYPECINGSEDTWTLVRASFNPVGDGAEEVGASLGLSFGMALWLAIFIHATGIEIYLNLTSRESEKLRMVSYERQMEAGYKNPGNAGLTAQRFGDVEEWVPKGENMRRM